MKKASSWFSRKPSVAFALSMLVVTLLPLCCGWIFYNQSSAVVKEQQENIVHQSLQLTMQTFDKDMIDMVNLSLSLKNSLSGLQLPDEETFTLENRLSIFEARAQMDSMLRSANSAIRGIYIIRPDADFAVDSDAQISRQILYTRYWRDYNISEKEFSLIHMQDESGAIINPHLKRPVFLLTISKDHKTGIPTKQLVLILNENYFPRLVLGSGLPDITYELYDRDGSLIFTNHKEIAKDARAFSISSSVSSYYMLAHVPRSSFAVNSGMLTVLYISMLIGTVILAAVLIWGLSRRTAMPINNIIKYIEDNYQVEKSGDAEGLSLIQQSVEQMLNEHEAHQKQLLDYQEKEEMHLLINAFLGLKQEHSEDDAILAPYVVAIFPIADSNDVEAMRNTVNAMPTEGYLKNCVILTGDLFLLLKKVPGDMDEDEACNVLESILQTLDDSGAQGLLCAMSSVHTTSQELSIAYREAIMSEEALHRQKDVPIMRFDAIRYTPEYFLRDFHHLEKQLAFAFQMGDQDYELAQSSLSALFPDEFLNDNTSVLSQLHLSSLKFQFLHDLTHSLSVTLEDADELNRINARDIMACQTHRELMTLMRRILSELNALPARQSEEPDMQIDEIKTYIRNNSWDRQLSVASVADAFNLTSNALSKLFSRKANMGVLQYIHKIRIENACNLLLSDESVNIADIATQVGYASTLTFNRAFKSRYNMTPSEYRRIHKPLTN